MSWYVYEVAPIDFGWENLRTVRETAELIFSRNVVGKDTPDIDVIELEHFNSAWKSAKDAANERGWDLDFRGDPVVFWVPCDTEFSYGFVIKQDDNGTTYVISPVAMPWLSI